MNRIERALRQRIYLIDRVDQHTFHVAGISNDYNVTLSESGHRGHRCTCRDFEKRQLCCKHIFWVLFKYFNLSPDEWLQNMNLLPQDWDFEHRPRQGAKRARVLEVDDTECSICLEDFDEHSDRLYCNICGHSFDYECYEAWARVKKKRECPLCRNNMTVKRRQIDDQ